MLRRCSRALLVLTLLVGSVALAAPGSAVTARPPRLQILVSNDDGVGAEGIAVLVDALRGLRNVRVTVVAPATNQSGTGSRRTLGAVRATRTTTANGHPATAVFGFPADSVVHALDTVMAGKPNVVVTGANEGQNLGGVTERSGTVGAARAAAARGIPALAVSADLEHPDYRTAAKLAAAWVEQHRTELAGPPTSPVLLQSLNVPTCRRGRLRGIAETTVSPSTEHAGDDANCASTLPQPTDDITAYLNGFASLSRPSVAPATSS